MLAYSFVGLTSELFADARRRGVPVKTDGPKARQVWASIGRDWIAVPRKAMPLLLGVTSIEGVVKAMIEIGGAPFRELTEWEIEDAELVIGRANSQGGGRCR